MPIVLKGLNELSCLQDACIFSILDTSLGTLWWIREDVWISKIQDYHSNRRSHPGMSVSESSFTQAKEYVQMLHGRSRRHGSSVTVQGLEGNHPDRITYFHSIGPAAVRIEARYFTPKTTELRPNDPDWTEHAAIVANNSKPRINPDEKEELLRWLAAKRERQPWRSQSTHE